MLSSAQEEAARIRQQLAEQRSQTLAELKSPELEARRREKDVKDVTPFWNRKKNGQPQA